MKFTLILLATLAASSVNAIRLPGVEEESANVLSQVELPGSDEISATDLAQVES